MFVDVGTYGTPKVMNFHPIETTRRVEEFVRNVNGYLKQQKQNIFIFYANLHLMVLFSFYRFQMLYADSYMTEKEFENMFDHSLYNEMRIKYDCDKAFPPVYGKVSRQARE